MARDLCVRESGVRERLMCAKDLRVQETYVCERVVCAKDSCVRKTDACERCLSRTRRVWVRCVKGGKMGRRASGKDGGWK